MQTQMIIDQAKTVLYDNIYAEDENLGAANRVLFTSRRVIVPSNPYYYGFWNWDGAFHMIGASLHHDRELARDQAETMFALQLGDGMFIDCARVDGSRVANFSKPPVWPWAFQTADEIWPLGDDFLAYSFSKLDANIKWWERERFDGTLYSYKVHPYESGMDDSPRFDLFWRGPCWLNTAYFAVKGLANYGFNSLALDYCRRILSWIEADGIWEYYDTQTNRGLGQIHFSWSSVFAVLFVLLYRELGGE